MHSTKMKRFFKHADDSGDGLVNEDEFRAVVGDQFVKNWLAAQEIDASNADKLFMLLDKGTHELSVEDLVSGVSKLKGVAKSIDLAVLQRETQQLHTAVMDTQSAIS